jgi:hypothetical protein
MIPSPSDQIEESDSLEVSQISEADLQEPDKEIFKESHMPEI